MADIVSELDVKAPVERVFAAVSTPAGLDAWWTKASAGEPRAGAAFTLDFGPGFLWRAIAERCEPPTFFELRLTDAHEDWRGTRVGFGLRPTEAGTRLLFHHTGWPEANEHYRVSCYCWQAYLRLLRRNLEYAEFVPYEKRLEV